MTNELLTLQQKSIMQLIQEWLLIYKGKQKWLKYKYATLQGTIQERQKLSLNMAKVICSELSQLVWGEMPIFNIDTSINDVLNNSKFDKKITEFTERLLALGGGAIKVYTKDNNVYLDFVPADRFLPISWGEQGIYEADFFDRKVIDNNIYLRVESHRKIENGYLITNKLYKEESGYYNEAPMVIYGDNIEIETYIPTTKPLFVYIKNVGDNNLIDDMPLGVSIYGNSQDTLEAIDTIFDALNQEIVLGRKRIIVPTTAVRSIVNSDTGKVERYFDPSDEIFQAFNVNDNDELKITDNSVELRVDQIERALQIALNLLSMQTGFSTGFFSFERSGLKTATEVISENSKTYKTKVNIENEFKTSLLNLFETLREILPLFGKSTSSNEYTITFDDNVIEDRNSKAEYWLKRYREGTCELKDVLMKLDGLTEDQAVEKANNILNANKTIDVDSLFGGTDNTITGVTNE